MRIPSAASLSRVKSEVITALGFTPRTLMKVRSTMAARAIGVMTRARQSCDRRGIAGEGHRDRGDGAGGNDQEQGPRIEERGKGTEGIAEVDVPAARLRSSAAELGVDEGAKHGHASTQQPRGDGEAGSAGPLCHDRAG